MILAIYSGSSRDEGYEVVASSVMKLQEIFHFPLDLSQNNTIIMINTTDAPSQCQEFKRESKAEKLTDPK